MKERKRYYYCIESVWLLWSSIKKNSIFSYTEGYTNIGSKSSGRKVQNCQYFGPTLHQSSFLPKISRCINKRSPQYLLDDKTTKNGTVSANRFQFVTNISIDDKQSKHFLFHFFDCLTF